MTYETRMSTPFSSDFTDFAPVGLVALDPAGKVIAVNATCEAIFGRSARNIEGKTLQDLTVASGALLSLIDRAREANTEAAASEVRLKPSALVEENIFSVRVRPAADGKLIIALMPELTHETESSLAGVASFGRILGHEIKNPLAGISGAAQLLLRQSQSGQRELLNLICEESARIERMVNRLSAFELFSKPHFAPVNIHQVLDRVVASEEAAFDGEVTFLRRYDPSLPDIMADGDHLHEAFQNIVRNGIEAALSQRTRRPPTITVNTAFETRFARRRRRKARDARGRTLRVDIIDTGPGLSVEQRDRVFEAFNSSKSVGRGLGLTIVKEVIQAHEGQVQIGAQDDGTIVSVFLPFLEGDAQ